MRRRLLAAAFAFAISLFESAAQAQPPPTVAAVVAAAVADPSRPAADVAKDAARRPAELLVFAGVKPGDKVMDVWPGGGYWSRLLSKAVGPSGQVFAYVPQEIAGFKEDPVGVAKATAAEPGLSNLLVVSDPLAEQPPAAFQNSVDVIWTFQNYHDLHDSFMKGADVAAFDRAAFLILKPGGVFVVADHAAMAGSGLKHTEDLHRIDPAQVKAELEAAGFVYDGETTVLANPKDPHTALVFDPSIRGRTDQFVYRFRKPA